MSDDHRSTRFVSGVMSLVAAAGLTLVNVAIPLAVVWIVDLVVKWAHS